ncbi:hypothetical protein [Methylobacterium sp. GC_Met_2]|uniref:hypothetical protein n=1 Tax=Methylobacterium sp. GC_Met_2 TaxID=2937376 RepID=UPI00226B66C7|nr:hypothetical protein [Methylobacterium sp. GC_Met_2]
MSHIRQSAEMGMPLSAPMHEQAREHIPQRAIRQIGDGQILRRGQTLYGGQQPLFLRTSKPLCAAEFRLYRRLGRLAE